jgi:hypothetical protein
MARWMVPIGFLLPSLLLAAWSVWRMISKSRRYKKPQYYDKDTIRNLV